MKKRFQDLEENDVFVYSYNLPNVTDGVTNIEVSTYIAFIKTKTKKGISFKDIHRISGEENTSENLDLMFNRLNDTESTDHNYKFVEFLFNQPTIIDKVREMRPEFFI